MKEQVAEKKVQVEELQLLLGKREEEVAEHVEMWHGKMRRLEAHGDEFKLAPVFKMNALRT